MIIEINFQDCFGYTSPKVMWTMTMKTNLKCLWTVFNATEDQELVPKDIIWLRKTMNDNKYWVRCTLLKSAKKLQDTFEDRAASKLYFFWFIITAVLAFSNFTSLHCKHLKHLLIQTVLFFYAWTNLQKFWTCFHFEADVLKLKRRNGLHWLVTSWDILLKSTEFYYFLCRKWAAYCLPLLFSLTIIDFQLQPDIPTLMLAYFLQVYFDL